MNLSQEIAVRNALAYARLRMAVLKKKKKHPHK